MPTLPSDHLHQNFPLEPNPPSPPDPISLPLPSSFASYPIRFPLPTGTFVQGRITEHVVTSQGEHNWRLLPPPADDPPGGIWVDTPALHRLFKVAHLSSRITQPARHSPSLHAISNFIPQINGSLWTSHHCLVGLVASVYLESSAQPTSPALPGSPKTRAHKRKLFSVTIAAALTPPNPNAPTQFWGRLHHDDSLSVIFPSLEALAEASHSNDIERRSRHRTHQKSSSQPPSTSEFQPHETNFSSELFKKAALALYASLPSDPLPLFQAGFRISMQKIPRHSTPLYRSGLSHITSELLKDPNNDALWTCFLLYDALILAPPQNGETFTSAIRRRVQSFLSGDMVNLFRENTSFRSQFTKPHSSPLHDDPALLRASNAQRSFDRHHAIGAAASALRAPAPSPSSDPQAHTTAFKALNPSTGSPAPHVPIHASIASSVPPPPVTPPLRRPLDPPSTSPPPFVLTTAKLIRVIRRSNPASAGGLSGTSYKTLRTWFLKPDTLSEDLTAVLNLIASGQVPPQIIPLLNAGRGIAIPKDDKGALRPIVIGHVLLRLLGSYALRHLSKEVQAFFLTPLPLQFGVGVPSGCELVAAAITAHLNSNQSHIDISCDARNAFNSWCRSQMWDTLTTHFPSLVSLVKLMYGSPSSILFFEPGSGLTEVLNSVGCKQGCSLGSFLFCLAIHPILTQLQTEFPDLLIIAYCDDVHIVGDPARAITAYHRWSYLYGSTLQGELRNDKGIAFAPNPNLDAPLLHSLGLPPDMKLTHAGLRVLGAPIGHMSFQATFASTTVDSILTDLSVLGLMPSLQSQHLLATKSVAHRINHLLRNIPGGETDLFGALSQRYDDALLLIPKRISRQISLSPLARLLCALPQNLGGLGYRTWEHTSDAAFLASYVHISQSFPSLFPQYATHYPSVLSLSPSSTGISTQAYFAFRAYKRLQTVAPTVSEYLHQPPTTVRHLQHDISTSIWEALSLKVTSLCHRLDYPSHPRHSATYHSNCGDSHTFSALPTDSDTTFANVDFEVITARRLLVQTTQNLSEKQQCPLCFVYSVQTCPSVPPSPQNVPVLDPFGDHALLCATKHCTGMTLLPAWSIVSVSQLVFPHSMNLTITWPTQTNDLTALLPSHHHMPAQPSLIAELNLLPQPETASNVLPFQGTQTIKLCSRNPKPGLSQLFHNMTSFFPSVLKLADASTPKVMTSSPLSPLLLVAPPQTGLLSLPGPSNAYTAPPNEELPISSVKPHLFWLHPTIYPPLDPVL